MVEDVSGRMEWYRSVYSEQLESQNRVHIGRIRLVGMWGLVTGAMAAMPVGRFVARGEHRYKETVARCISMHCMGSFMAASASLGADRQHGGSSYNKITD